jgi:hypothetical protein
VLELQERLGLLLYTWCVFAKAERTWLVGMAVTAALIAGAVGAVIAALM